MQDQSLATLDYADMIESLAAGGSADFEAVNATLKDAGRTFHDLKAELRLRMHANVDNSISQFFESLAAEAGLGVDDLFVGATSEQPESSGEPEVELSFRGAPAQAQCVQWSSEGRELGTSKISTGGTSTICAAFPPGEHWVYGAATGSDGSVLASRHQKIHVADDGTVSEVHAA